MPYGHISSFVKMSISKKECRPRSVSALLAREKVMTMNIGRDVFEVRAADNKGF